MFKNGVEKLFEYEFREFGNFPMLHTSHLEIEKEFWSKIKKKWLHARGINRWADRTRKIAIKLCGAAQKTQLNLPRESLALDGPKELWLLGKMTNARGSSLARGQNEGRLFRGWLPRARIYRKNERLLARGGEISNVSKVTPLVEEFGIKILRGSSSKWES